MIVVDFKANFEILKDSERYFQFLRDIFEIKSLENLIWMTVFVTSIGTFACFTTFLKSLFQLGDSLYEREKFLHHQKVLRIEKPPEEAD